MSSLEILTSLLLSKDPAESLLEFSKTPLCDEILPEFNALKMEVAPGYHHKDNFKHTLKVVSNAVMLEGQEPDLVLRMAALLHDIGKPATRSFEGTKVSFTDHDNVGASLARTRLEKLGFESSFIKEVCLLISLHLRTFNYHPGKWTDAGVRRYALDAGDSLERLNKLIRADVTTANLEKAKRLSLNMDDLEAKIKRVKEEAKEKSLRPPLSGNEVMSIFGIDPGPSLGLIMKNLLLLTRQGKIKTSQDAEREVSLMLKNSPELLTSSKFG